MLTHLPLGTAFLALSLREAGYSVWANTDASGTFSANLAADANRRMEQAGVHLVSQGIVPVRSVAEKPADGNVRHNHGSHERLEEHARPS